jgi:hypothetical protein
MLTFADNGLHHVKQLIKKNNSHVEAMHILQSLKTDNQMKTNVKEFIIAECAMNKDVYDQVCVKNDQISHAKIVDAYMNSDSLSLTSAMMIHIMPFTDKETLNELMLKYGFVMTMKDHSDYYQLMYPKKFTFFKSVVPICTEKLTRFIHLLTSYTDTVSYTSLGYQYLDVTDQIESNYASIISSKTNETNETKSKREHVPPHTLHVPHVLEVFKDVNLEELIEERKCDLEKISNTTMMVATMMVATNDNDYLCSVEELQVDDIIYTLQLVWKSNEEIMLKLNKKDVMKLVLNKGVIVDELALFSLMVTESDLLRSPPLRT